MTEKAIFNDESAKGIWIDHFFKEYIPGVSTDCVDEAAKKMVAEFLTKPELHNAVGVWNFCKELLDWGAYGALFSPFEMTALDLERSYGPAQGYGRVSGQGGRRRESVRPESAVWPSRGFQRVLFPPAIDRV